MPTLQWIGKEAIENHHNEVPFHLLNFDESLSVSPSETKNLLIQGDNLTALKALLPYYAGKVKCIYIDPPYNKGAEMGWTYNDSVDSPEIKKWLGQAVGKENEDLSRHDKWLCMMYPRMRLLVEFLKQDGFFFVSLDDSEVARFKLLMDEILPPKSFITTLIWKSRRNLDNRSLHNVSVDHEYVVAYRKDEGRFRGTPKERSKYRNPDNDPRGDWMSDNLVGLATKDRRPNLHYELINPKTGIVYKCPPKGWRYSRDTMAIMIEEERILWPKKISGRPRNKKFWQHLINEFAGFSSFIECGNTNEGTDEVSRIMGGEQFIFPKPRSLIEALLEQTTSDNDIIMDTFAGTGTTGHAVLNLNKKDGGKRKFILVEMDKDICVNITRERLLRVIGGYSYENGDNGIVHIDGLGGGFQYFNLGRPLFDEKGRICQDITFRALAAHIYYIETSEPLGKRPNPNSPLIAINKDTAIYLLYNGILGDRKIDGGNILTNKILKSLPEHSGPKIIYGEGCRLGPARLKDERIIFKQIPYHIKVK